MNGDRTTLDLARSFLLWATGAVLALGLYIASSALDKLAVLDQRIQNHEIRITVIEETSDL